MFYYFITNKYVRKKPDKILIFFFFYLKLCESQKHLTTKLLPKRGARILKQTLKFLEDLSQNQGLESMNSLDRDFKRKKRDVNIYYFILLQFFYYYLLIKLLIFSKI